MMAAAEPPETSATNDGEEGERMSKLESVPISVSTPAPEQEALRRSGIDVIGDVPWGTHFCQFYETRDDLVDVLVPYFKAGLEANEYCMWITSEPLDAKAAELQLAQAMPDFERQRARGALEILPHDQWYLLGGGFDQERVLAGWVARLEDALSRGFDGLRLSGNTFWLEKSGWSDFAAYEDAVNDVIGRYRMIALCTYSLDRCNASEVLDVVRTHQFALIKRRGSWQLIESSDRKRAIDEIERLNDDLETFSTFAAHELRAPLRGMAGFARLLEEEAAPLGRQAALYVQAIGESVARMEALIDAILSFSRAGRSRPASERVDMELLAREALEELDPSFAGRQVEVEIGPLPPARGDRGLLRGVIENLLANAIKFTRERELAHIELQGEVDGERCVYRVIDNGVGFDPSHQEKLFRPFERLHAPAEYPGSGLGLALVSRIVERHGGRVWAEGRPGEGASFYFSLPSG
jgi:signal transduction histidine kinase